MAKLSIVVPVYNSQDYIEKTLEALCAQRVDQLEIVVIDDGSQDASGEKCLAFSQRDPRVKYCKISNSGPGNARNVGIEKAQGDYIGFCDADDIPEPGMYETLLDYLQRKNADLALCDIYSQRDGRSFGFPWEDETVFSGAEGMRELMGSMIGKPTDDFAYEPVWGSVCRGLYKKSLIEAYGIRFPADIHFAEDLVFTLRYLARANSVVICDKPLYFYTSNEGSVMHSFYSYKPGMFRARKALVTHIRQIVDSLDDREPLLRRLTVTQRCYYHECVGNACRRAQGHNARDAYRELREILNDTDVKKAFSRFDTSQRKKKLLYQMIKYRCAFLIYLYYSVRFAA